jgi:thioredoxin reductase (NADPH)
MSSPANQPASGTDYDVIIIGGAAAGLTAALYASRRALRTLVVTKSLGGQAAMTPSIENFPGTEQINGIDLMLRFQDHAMKQGAQVKYETVSALRKDGETFVVTATGGEYTAEAVILAFGLTPRNLGVPGEEELQGKGVTYCATCDGPLFKKKRVAVVGGTHEALDAALFMAKLEADVTLVHARADYPAYPKMFGEVKANPKIQLRLNAKVLAVEGAQRVEGLKIESADHGEETLAVDGVFVENGHKIDSKWLGDLVEFDKKNSVMVTELKETKTPGLFAAGDLTPQRDKQVVVSAGAGAVAALSAYHYLQKKAGKPALLVDWDHSEET